MARVALDRAVERSCRAGRGCRVASRIDRSLLSRLWFAQTERKHDSVEMLKGFGSGRVLEVVESFEGNAYRAVYTVKFEGYVYVLHCFQKKSKRGRKTPMLDVTLIESRLKLAGTDYKKRTEGK